MWYIMWFKSLKQFSVTCLYILIATLLNSEEEVVSLYKRYQQLTGRPPRTFLTSYTCWLIDYLNTCKHTLKWLCELAVWDGKRSILNEALCGSIASRKATKYCKLGETTFSLVVELVLCSTFKNRQWAKDYMAASQGKKVMHATGRMIENNMLPIRML